MIRLTTLLVAGAVVAGGCGLTRPPARYPADLKPCDLLTQDAAEDLLGVGELPNPSNEKGWLGEYTMNVYCTWTYEREADPPAGGPPVPTERSLGIGLVVYPADYGDGGDAEAREAVDRRDGDAVDGIGDRAVWTYEGEPWYKGTLTLRRANAVVTVSYRGTDCCRDGWHERDVDEAETRKTATEAARLIDRKLTSTR